MLGRGSIDWRKSSVRPIAVGDVQKADVAFENFGEVAEFLDEGACVSDWFGSTCCLLHPLPNLQIPYIKVSYALYKV